MSQVKNKKKKRSVWKKKTSTEKFVGRILSSPFVLKGGHYICYYVKNIGIVYYDVQRDSFLEPV